MSTTVTRPKTRTAQLDAAVVTEIKQRFGTLKNAFLVLAPSNHMTQDVFTRVAAGRPSLKLEVAEVIATLATWKKANLK